MYFVYILKSVTTRRYYIGSTGDIKKRLERHNNGRNRSTYHGRPWILVYQEMYATKQEAYKREYQIKRYKHGEAFKKLIRDYQK